MKHLHKVLMYAFIMMLLPVMAKADSRAYIYYIGNTSPLNWTIPIEDNAAAFEDYKLYETSPGSNVFEGEIYFDSYWESTHYFRFYTKLNPVGQYMWMMNTINPAEDVELEISSNQLATTLNCTVTIFNPDRNHNNCWYYKANGNEFVRFTVDLNKNTVKMVRDVDVLLINRTDRPSEKESASFPQFKKGTKVYVPSGPYTLMTYNYYTDKLKGADYAKSIYSEDFSTGKSPAQVNNWSGGTIVCDGNKITFDCASLNYKAPADISEWDEFYIVGDFNGWNIDNAEPLEQDGDIFRIRLNDFEGYFKIVGQKFWGNLDMGTDEVMTVGNTIYFKPTLFGSNMYIDTLGDYIIEVNRTNSTVCAYPAEFTCSDAAPDDMFEFKDTTDPFNGYILSTNYDFTDLSNADISKILNHCTVLSQDNSDPDYEYSTEFEANEIMKVRILKIENDKVVTVYAPAANTTVRTVKGVGTSRYTTSDSYEDTNYWAFDKMGKVKLSFNPNSTAIDAVKFDFGFMGNCIYFVGLPEGWRGPSEPNKEHYQNYAMAATTDGGYYGWFDIAAGEAMFRFYSALTGWEDDSWGCQEYDQPIDFEFVDGSSYELMPGKGTYDFFDWQGGTMYIYANLTKGYMRVSASPMDYEFAEDPGDEAPISPQIIGSNFTYDFENAGDGIYTCRVFLPELKEPMNVYLYKRPFADIEPEWRGSYNIVFDAPMAEFDNCGVAEFSIENVKEVSTDEPMSISVIDDTELNNEIPWCYLRLDLNEGKLYIDKLTHGYLVGTLTDGEVPTYATRANFPKALVKHAQAFDVMMPAGELDLAYYRLYEGSLDSEAENLVFDDNMVAYTEKKDYQERLQRVHADNYPGGWTRYSYCGIPYNWDPNSNVGSTLVANLENLHFAVNSYGKSYPLENVEGSDHEYAGTFTAPEIQQGMLFSSISLKAEESEFIYYIFPDTRYFVDNVLTSEIIPSGGGYSGGTGSYRDEYSIHLFQVSDQKIDINFSIDTHQLTMNVADGRASKVMLLFTNDDNDNSSITESTIKDGITDATVPVAKTDEDLELNIGGMNGNDVLTPADGEDVNVEFDENGSFTGKYVSKTTQPAARRAAAANMPKWKFPVTEDANIRIVIDENNETITIVNSNEIKNIYALTDYYYLYNNDNIRDCAMTVNPDGTMTTRVNLSTERFVKFVNTFDSQGFYYAGLCGIFGGSDITVTSEADFETNYLVGTSKYTADMWYGDTDEVKTYIVTYNPATQNLAFMNVEAEGGIDEVKAGSPLAVHVVDGGIVVDADSATNLTVYNMQGVAVRTLSIPAGATRIDLPAGLYIAAGVKVVVK